MVSFVHTIERKVVKQDASGLRVIFISDAAADRNGVGSYYRDLVGYLESRLESVDFITPTKQQSGLYLMSLPMPGDPTQKVRVPHVPLIAQRIRRSKPHVIVVSSPGLFGLLGLALAYRYKIPLCVGIHTDYDKLADMYWDGFMSRISRGYLRRVHQFLIRGSSAVLAVTDDMADVARVLGARKPELIGSPIAEDFLKAPIHRASRPMKKVLFAGRLAPEKNVPALLDAARVLPDITFCIAGDGPLRKKVVEMSSALPNVDYLGWLSREELLRTFDHVDLLALPSHVESFGTIALEASARCCPVLVSSTCGLLKWDEIARNVFTIHRDESVADAIRRVSEVDPEMRLKMQYAARKAVESFNEKTINQWEIALQKLSDGHVPASRNRPSFRSTMSRLTAFPS